jgi:hypothetical protein
LKNTEKEVVAANIQLSVLDTKLLRTPKEIKEQIKERREDDNETHTQNIQWNRERFCSTRAEGIYLPSGVLQIITPICKPSSISLCYSLNLRPINVDQYRSTSA